MMRLRISATVLSACVLLILPLGVAGCRPAAPSSTPPVSTHASPLPENKSESLPPSPFLFVDRQAELQIEWTYKNDEEADRFSMVESLGGGVGIVDFDLDGWPDLVLPGGGGFSDSGEILPRPTGLFKNDWQHNRFYSVADQARLPAAASFSHGVAAADFDNDGFTDILITGYARLQFCRNQGDGTFLDETHSAGLNDALWSSSAAWGDVNGDGFLDLYVAHYLDWRFDKNPICPGRPPKNRDVCPPRQFDPLPDVLYVSRGDGTFEDATSRAGLRPDGKGLGVLMVDIDEDGDLDIYVTNDTVENFLYVNDGTGQFSDHSVLSGAAYNEKGFPDGSMGIDLADFDGDGLADFFVTNYEGELPALYRNLGQGIFRHVSQQQGMAVVGMMNVGWGVRTADLDNDRDIDVVIANGHVTRFPETGTSAQRPVLFENRGETFRNASSQSGSYFVQEHAGRGLASTDFNRDGRLDIVISQINSPVAVLENQSSNRNSSLRIQLIGRESPRNGIGAIAHLASVDGRTQTQFIAGGGSFASTNELIVHFGLGETPVDHELTILWPSHKEQSFTVASSVRELVVLEGATNPVSDTTAIFHP